MRSISSSLGTTLLTLFACTALATAGCSSEENNDGNGGDGAADAGTHADGEHDDDHDDHDDHDGEAHDDHDGEAHDEDGHEHDMEPWSEHACVHFDDTPMSVDAGADLASAGEVSEFDHKLVAIKLMDAGDGTFKGVVKVIVPEMGHFHIHLDADAHLHIHDSADKEIEASASITAQEQLGCAKVAKMNMYDLEVMTYEFEFEGAPAETLLMVIEESAMHDGDDGHDH